MVVFKAKTRLTMIIYITPKHYEYITFDTRSDGSSVLYCKNDVYARALFNTDEYKKGIITSDTKPEDIAPKAASVPAKKAEEAQTSETDETVEDTTSILNETQNDGKETMTFADFAMAVSFLVERGGKKSELRSVKAVKERGAELGYNIIIEE